jgi:hypothetical protein
MRSYGAMTAVLTGESLTLDDVVRVARALEPVALADTARERIRAARTVVEAALADGAEVYGLTTGVGVRKRARIDGDYGTFNARSRQRSPRSPSTTRAGCWTGSTSPRRSTSRRSRRIPRSSTRPSRASAC